jgi:uncharacterized integral membrane protein
MKIKRIISLIILLPSSLLLIAFIFVNRTPVQLRFNPFNEKNLSFTAPLFFWLFAFLAFGILIGSLRTLLNKKYKERNLYKKEFHEDKNN